MPVRLPSYIYRNRCGIFYFRVILPVALAIADAQREFRVSLHTPERSAAVLEARYLAHRIAELFAALEMTKKRTTGHPAALSAEQFRRWLDSQRVKYRAIERVE